MPNVFLKTHSDVPLKEKILKALRQSEWISTGQLYRATKNAVKQADMHAVLKTLLASREIRMRCIENTGGPARTEFKLLQTEK